MNKTIPRFAQTSLLLVTVLGINCSKSETEEPKEKAVYVCRETKEVVVAPVQPTPAINPATGRKTLLRALYCPEGKRWRAVPPDAATNGHPMNSKCPQHHCRLTADGPLPKQ